MDKNLRSRLPHHRITWRVACSPLSWIHINALSLWHLPYSKETEWGTRVTKAWAYWLGNRIPTPLGDSDFLTREESEIPTRWKKSSCHLATMSLNREGKRALQTDTQFLTWGHIWQPGLKVPRMCSYHAAWDWETKQRTGRPNCVKFLHTWIWKFWVFHPKDTSLFPWKTLQKSWQTSKLCAKPPKRIQLLSTWNFNLRLWQRMALAECWENLETKLSIQVAGAGWVSMAHHGRLNVQDGRSYSPVAKSQRIGRWPNAHTVLWLEKQKQSADTCALERFPGRVADPVQVTTRTGLHNVGTRCSWQLEHKAVAASPVRPWWILDQ